MKCCCRLAGEYKYFGVIYSLPFQCLSSYDFTMKTLYLTGRFWFFRSEILCPFNSFAFHYKEMLYTGWYFYIKFVHNVFLIYTVSVFYFILFCFALFCFVLFCFVLFYFILFYFILFYFILFYFILFLFYSFPGLCSCTEKIKSNMATQSYDFRRFGTLCLFHLHRQVGVKND
jgi:hypothetical protein